MGGERTIETDVLIVGAGPGGSAAAYHLARHGIDVTLVEKATFPREKVCGDGLTPRAVKAMQAMGIDTGDPGFERVVGLRVYSRHTTIELPWPELETFPDYGLVMPTEKTCAKCHNEKGTGGKFVDWKADSAKIDHSIPAGFVRGAEAAAPAGE